jgi:hypothetical protein
MPVKKEVVSVAVLDNTVHIGSIKNTLMVYQMDERVDLIPIKCEDGLVSGEMLTSLKGLKRGIRVLVGNVNGSLEQVTKSARENDSDREIWLVANPNYREEATNLKINFFDRDSCWFETPFKNFFEPRKAN